MSWILRQVKPSDTPQLYEWAKQSGGGLTSLPSDRSSLTRKVDLSVALFAKIAQHERDARSLQKADKSTTSTSYICEIEREDLKLTPQEEEALLYFVLEDETQKGAEKSLMGVCALKPWVGQEEDFYQITKGAQENHSWHLERARLDRDYTELCSLYLSKETRGKKLGRFLSWSRFLYLARYQKLFAPHLLAQFRGYLDNEGESPIY